MATTVVVTGATGSVGGKLARRLREAGVGVRAIGRSAGRLAELTAMGAETLIGDLDDADFLTRAFSGADAGFLMVPPSFDSPDFRADQRRLVARDVEAVARAELPRVVTLSSVGAELADGTGPIAGLHDLEEALNALPWLHLRHLRPAYFMENHLASIGLIKAQGMLGSAIRADTPFGQVATPDIAAYAAAVLQGASFTGRSVQYLSGPRDYSMNQVARILGAAIGKPDLAYVTFPPDATKRALMGAGMSSNVAGLYVEMMEALGDGRIRPLQPRESGAGTPTTMEQFGEEVFAPAYRATNGSVSA